jgi:diguanylate cyclase (GGDEF)-like protein
MSHHIAARIHAQVEQGAIKDAIAAAHQALPSAHGENAGHLLLALSNACVSGGDYLEGLRAAVAASDAFKAAGSEGGVCDALIKVGVALRAAGDHASAVTTLEQAEAIARDSGDDARRAAVLRQVAVCCSLVGRHQQALSCFNEVLSLQQHTGQAAELLASRLSFYNALNRQAVADPPESPERQASLEKLLKLWPALADDAAAAGSPRLALMARGNYGITLHESGRHREAVQVLEGLLPQYRANGMRPNEAICLMQLGHCHHARGAHGAARARYLSAIGLLRNDGSLDDLYESLEGLSKAEEGLGDHRAALAALREAQLVNRRKTDEAARVSASQRELRIELARLTHQWAIQATQDPLTGLSNRRGLERWIAEHLPRAEQGEPVTLLLADLDHFKSINDRFGHGVGDEVLRRVAGVIRGSCRGRDLAARYGGEEFVLALASVDYDAAIEVAHRLRESIQAYPWDRLTCGLTVSASIGVAQGVETADAVALLTLADRRLYAAKYGGRNQVVCSG